MRRRESRVRFGVFLFVAIFGLAAQLSSQGGGEARQGALELTPGLGRASSMHCQMMTA
jgi:hypothetical protein